ncbi:MAG: ParB/RepB/Spo0J family partition protein [Lachnospiraceae bacterium]|nr:ParB/RepB/Spo0J family partition protein [Lachnospiraceae bacterium]
MHTVQRRIQMSKQSETITFIPIEKLIPFRDHPFQIRDDEQMKMITESIRSVGVLVPAIARPLPDGKYELISGHRRKRASEILGLSTLPVIIRVVDHDTATVMMVDSNFQREEILPSERARAYKMKLEAIKRQGARTDLTSDQVGQKSDRKSSRDLIAENSPDSSSQIQRYLRLNELIPELLLMVDERKIALTPAAEISYLTKEEQEILLVTIESEMSTPSLSQAQRMKHISRERKLTDEMILQIMSEKKKPECWNLVFPMNKVSKYFPKSYTPKRMEETIYGLLEGWRNDQSRREKA